MGAPNEGQKQPVDINLIELLESVSEDQYQSATIVLENEGVLSESQITNVLSEALRDVNRLDFNTQMKIKQMFCDGKFGEKEYGEEEVKPVDDACQKPEE
jgi:hypothetical protein